MYRCTGLVSLVVAVGSSAMAYCIYFRWLFVPSTLKDFGQVSSRAKIDPGSRNRPKVCSASSKSRTKDPKDTKGTNRDRREGVYIAPSPADRQYFVK
jgi:hypothetical protein